MLRWLGWSVATFWPQAACLLSRLLLNVNQIVRQLFLRPQTKHKKGFVFFFFVVVKSKPKPTADIRVRHHQSSTPMWDSINDWLDWTLQNPPTQKNKTKLQSATLTDSSRTQSPFIHRFKWTRSAKDGIVVAVIRHNKELRGTTRSH